MERLDKLVGSMDGSNVDALIVLDKTNFRYLAGGIVDYSLAYILRDGRVGIISPSMEFERARLSTWADEVYAFSREKSDEKVVEARSNIEAFKKVYGDLKRIAVPFSSINHSTFLKLTEVFGRDKIVDGDEILLDSRLVKTSFELGLIRKAIDIVESGVLKGIETIEEGVSELDIAFISHCHMKRLGADKVYDDLIVASGERAALPHGKASNRSIRYGDVITLDFVASYEGYNGDETRTVFLGNADEELKKIYEVVLEALVNAIDTISEGVPARDVDKKARETIEKAGYGKYFLHSTGHGIGLDIHENPRLSSGDETILKEGMVVTVEPGIYLSGLGGVRIEEDVVVKFDGCEILTRNSHELTIL